MICLSLNLCMLCTYITSLFAISTCYGFTWQFNVFRRNDGFDKRGNRRENRHRWHLSSCCSLFLSSLNLSSFNFSSLRFSSLSCSASCSLRLLRLLELLRLLGCSGSFGCSDSSSCSGLRQLLRFLELLWAPLAVRAPASPRAYYLGKIFQILLNHTVPVSRVWHHSSCLI